MKTIWAIAGTIALLIVMAFSGSIGKYFGNSAAERFLAGKKSGAIDAVLMKTASYINEKLPIMIDKDTRLDSTVGLSRRFQYHYTMVAMTPSDVDQSVLRSQFSPMVKKRACTNKDMKAFFKNGVTVDYVYHGKNGNQIAVISVTPSECGY